MSEVRSSSTAMSEVRSSSTAMNEVRSSSPTKRRRRSSILKMPTTSCDSNDADNPREALKELDVNRSRLSLTTDRRKKRVSFSSAPQIKEFSVVETRTIRRSITVGSSSKEKKSNDVIEAEGVRAPLSIDIPSEAEGTNPFVPVKNAPADLVVLANYTDTLSTAHEDQNTCRPTSFLDSLRMGKRDRKKDIGSDPLATSSKSEASNDDDDEVFLKGHKSDIKGKRDELSFKSFLDTLRRSTKNANEEDTVKESTSALERPEDMSLSKEGFFDEEFMEQTTCVDYEIETAHVPSKDEKSKETNYDGSIMDETDCVDVTIDQGTTLLKESISRTTALSKEPMSGVDVTSNLSLMEHTKCLSSEIQLVRSDPHSDSIGDREECFMKDTKCISSFSSSGNAFLNVEQAQEGRNGDDSSMEETKCISSPLKSDIDGSMMEETKCFSSLPATVQNLSKHIDEQDVANADVLMEETECVSAASKTIVPQLPYISDEKNHYKVTGQSECISNSSTSVHNISDNGPIDDGSVMEETRCVASFPMAVDNLSNSVQDKRNKWTLTESVPSASSTFVSHYKETSKYQASDSKREETMCESTTLSTSVHSTSHSINRNDERNSGIMMEQTECVSSLLSIGEKANSHSMMEETKCMSSLERSNENVPKPNVPTIHSANGSSKSAMEETNYKLAIMKSTNEESYTTIGGADGTKNNDLAESSFTQIPTTPQGVTHETTKSLLNCSQSILEGSMCTTTTVQAIPASEGTDLSRSKTENAQSNMLLKENNAIVSLPTSTEPSSITNIQENSNESMMDMTKCLSTSMSCPSVSNEPCVPAFSGAEFNESAMEMTGCVASHLEDEGLEPYHVDSGDTSQLVLMEETKCVGTVPHTISKEKQVDITASNGSFMEETECLLSTKQTMQMASSLFTENEFHLGSASNLSVAMEETRCLPKAISFQDKVDPITRSEAKIGMSQSQLLYEEENARFDEPKPKVKHTKEQIMPSTSERKEIVSSVVTHTGLKRTGGQKAFGSSMVTPETMDMNEDQEAHLKHVLTESFITSDSPSWRLLMVAGPLCELCHVQNGLILKLCVDRLLPNSEFAFSSIQLIRPRCHGRDNDDILQLTTNTLLKKNLSTALLNRCPTTSSLKSLLDFLNSEINAAHECGLALDTIRARSSIFDIFDGFKIKIGFVSAILHRSFAVIIDLEDEDCKYQPSVTLVPHLGRVPSKQTVEGWQERAAETGGEWTFVSVFFDQAWKFIKEKESQRDQDW